MHHSYYSTSPVAQYPNPNPGSPARASPPYAAHAHTHAHVHPTYTSIPTLSPVHAPARTSRADVSTAMHNLILAMKHIQETLRLWSLGQASPEQVSDCYMQFGVEFNVIVHAFEEYGIGTGCVPLLPLPLRTTFLLAPPAFPGTKNELALSRIQQ